MEKTKEPTYVRLTVKEGKLAIEGSPLKESTIVAKKGDAIMSCEKHIRDCIRVYTEIKAKIDFVLMCGNIGFYCERNTAKQIVDLQEALDIVVSNEFSRIMKSLELYKKKTEEEKEIALEKASEKNLKAIMDARINLLLYIRSCCADKFLPYGYVNFKEMCDFIGSYYTDKNSQSSIYHDKYYSGIINIDEYIASLKEKRYMDGIFPHSESISKPIDFLEECMNSNSMSAYFGYGVPVTSKCNVGKTKALKAKETSN